VHAPVRACAGGKQRVVPDVVVKKVESGFYQGQAGAFAARKFAAGEVLAPQDLKTQSLPTCLRIYYCYL
jgi:hypothetical protein